MQHVGNAALPFAKPDDAGDVTRPEGVPEGDVPSSHGGERLLDLVRVMTRLRAPGGCPWDREQDHRSLARHLLEEAHEVLDAIDANDTERLREELGDLLLQVVFHAEMAREAGDFDVDDVAEGIVAKLIRRHPHVFGDTTVEGAGEVLVNWERIKQEEKGEHHIEHDIPATLPALARAAKVQRRAAGIGFEWRTEQGAMAKLREEVEELEEVARRVEARRAASSSERTPRSEQELEEVARRVEARRAASSSERTPRSEQELEEVARRVEARRAASSSERTPRSEQELEEVARRVEARRAASSSERTPRSEQELERVEAELGDVLFAAVSVGRTFGIDAESALRRSTRTFAERYESMLELARERGLDVDALSEDELLALFREARSAERSQ